MPDVYMCDSRANGEFYARYDLPDLEGPDDIHDIGLDTDHPSAGEEGPMDSCLEWLLGTMLHSSAGKRRPGVASAGDVIILRDGSYRHFRNTHPYRGPEPITIAALNSGKVRIRPNPVGGSQTHYVEAGHNVITRGLVFGGDDLSAIQNENAFSKRFENDPDAEENYLSSDVHFQNCDIDGGWDFRTATGVRNKWGGLHYFLGRTRKERGTIGWSWRGGRMTGIAKEHIVGYIHGLRGNVEYSDLWVDGAGRTAFQFTGRQGEGPPSAGNVLVKNVVAQNTGLEQGGGGACLSIKGGGRYKVFLDHVVMRQGCDDTLHPVYHDNVVGNVVAHMPDDAHQWQPSLVMSNSRMVMGLKLPGRGSARRPNVDLAHLELCRLRGHNEIWCGPGTREALVLDLDTIGRLALEGTQDIQGDVLIKHHGRNIAFKDPARDGRGWLEARTWMMTNDIATDPLD